MDGFWLKKTPSLSYENILSTWLQQRYAHTANIVILLYITTSPQTRHRLPLV